MDVACLSLFSSDQHVLQSKAGVLAESLLFL